MRTMASVIYLIQHYRYFQFSVPKTEQKKGKLNAGVDPSLPGQMNFIKGWANEPEQLKAATLTFGAVHVLHGCIDLILHL